MEIMKYLKGPWKAKRWSIHLSDTLHYGVTSKADWDVSATELTAIANLMSAAPDLLKIAEAYRNLLRTSAQTDGEVATFQHIVNVLAKAKGE